MGWVTLGELKNDNSLDAQVTSRDDEYLQRVLDAAMDYVQDHRPDLTFTTAATVPKRVRLGTLRLAAHWSIQRGVDLGELGSRRSRALDPDIKAMLGLR